MSMEWARDLVSNGFAGTPGVEAVDGTRQVRAWRPLGQSGLYICVQIGEYALLAPARRANDGSFLWAGILSVVLVALAITGAQEIRHRQWILQETERSREAEESRKLERAQRLAALGQTTMTIAHEINQPLAVIAMAAENGLLSLEMGEIHVDQLAVRLRRISAHAHRLATVMNHIRMFSGPDDQTQAAFEINDVVADTLMLAESRLRSAGVAVTTDIQPDLPALQVPRVPLEQVLLNIIVNACDKYEEGLTPDVPEDRPLLIVVRLTDGAITFSIADRAGGIPPEVLGNIFQPFFTTKPREKGTGIGLSVSHATITGMGGTLTAYNEHDGAVFEIRLPYVTTASFEDAAQARL
jgi:C4-dicarboxylate-specific signal transduction histidine kinase